MFITDLHILPQSALLSSELPPPEVISHTTTRARLHLSWTDSQRSNKDATISNHVRCRNPNLSAILFWSFEPLISHCLQNFSRKEAAIKASWAQTKASDSLSLAFPSHPQLWPTAACDPSQTSDSRRSPWFFPKRRPCPPCVPPVSSRFSCWQCCCSWGRQSPGVQMPGRAEVAAACGEGEGPA